MAGRNQSQNQREKAPHPDLWVALKRAQSITDELEAKLQNTAPAPHLPEHSARGRGQRMNRGRRDYRDYSYAPFREEYCPEGINLNHSGTIFNCPQGSSLNPESFIKDFYQLALDSPPLFSLFRQLEEQREAAVVTPSSPRPGIQNELLTEGLQKTSIRQEPEL